MRRIPQAKDLWVLSHEYYKINQERINLSNSRHQPVQSDYVNFRLNGLDVSDYDFVTLDGWLEEKGEIYE